ncbi:PAS domain S-box-containing protein [Pseudozobellia thermophila]|uniref:histidine kinase n=1 Tax=Pseudozobellia thermophila TaxID=192903 RepID=A0A1M6AT98_9FLAO|nr:PAS domain S-box-containing protein [Pseudozobellia thermophila]
MHFQAYSDVWRHSLCPDQTDFQGREFFTVLPHIPEAFRQIFNQCLNGKSIEDPGKKFIAQDGSIKWYKWRLNPRKDTNGSIVGLIVVLEDITQLQMNQELVLKAERVARIGGWEIDLLTNKIHWTDVTKEIHEVPKDYSPHLQEGINFYKEGIHRDTISKVVDRAISEGTPWDVELIIVTAKGNELWVRAMGDVEMLNGKCIRVFGTFQDIDDKKRTELQLREVSKRLSIATSGSHIGIWEYNIKSKESIWDENMYKLFNVEQGEFDPNDFGLWLSTIHPEDREALLKNYGEALSGKREYRTEFRIVRPDGGISHLGARAVLVRDEFGQPLKMVGTNFDITELKNTRSMLERSEKSFQGAFEKSNTGMALVDIAGQWIRVNQSLCKSLGYTEEELMRLSFQEITYPENLEESLIAFRKVINGETNSYRLEKKYLHKKGHIVHGILTVTAVRDNNDQLEHLIAQVIDITERKNAEVELTRLLHITKQQNDSLLNFAHIVSHNLRSHATNLSMLTGFIKQEKDPKEISEIHHMLSDASESLNETVLHLNEVVQLKVGVSEKMKPVNLYKTLKNVKKNLNTLIQKKNVVLHLQFPENLTVMGIPAYIDSIFLNLISNSIKYSSPDRAPEITISSKASKNRVILSIADNGLGINLDRHGKKIFGMYKTFHRNKDAKGIGLFITKNQIEAMNGTIEVQSTVNEGTTFTLHFEVNQKLQEINV